MHEVSLVLNIVDIATSERDRAGTGFAITAIELEIGQLAGVEAGALELAWPVATRDTCLDGLPPTIRWVPAVAHCAACAVDFPVQAWYERCPHCDQPFDTLIQGRELRVKSLTLRSREPIVSPPT